jgi:hypothetical protein
LKSEISLGLDILITDPRALAEQISNLVKAPARAILAGAEALLDAYSGLANTIFGSSAGRPSDTLSNGSSIKTRRTRVSNDFHMADLFAMNSVGGSVLSVVESQFSTKPQALTAAEAILVQFDQVVAWRDSGFEALREIDAIGAYQLDTGGSYQALQRAVALTAGFLIEISFSLVPERRIVLDRARTIVDLAAELYGSVDERLDQLINSNNLTGSEILELPRGKTIAYYPDN